VAAEGGLADAQYALGSKYENGEGVPQNYDLAEKWYRESAEQGDVFGQARLAMFHTGIHGRRKDLVQVYVWSSLAAAQGTLKSSAKIRDFAAKYMSRKDVAKAQNIAARFVAKPTAVTQMGIARHKEP
jgi:hypothetical protein